jgi:hypothetical protein
MRGVAIVLCAALASGCMSAELREQFEARLASVDQSWTTERARLDIQRQTLAGEIAVLKSSYAAGKTTDAEFAARIEALNAEAALASRTAEDARLAAAEHRAAIEGELEAAKSAAVAEAIATWAARIETGSKLVEVTAPTLGGVAGTFWPFATFLGGLAARAAGLLGAAAGAVKRQSGGGA